MPTSHTPGLLGRRSAHKPSDHPSLAPDQRLERPSKNRVARGRRGGGWLDGDDGEQGQTHTHTLTHTRTPRQ